MQTTAGQQQSPAESSHHDARPHSPEAAQASPGLAPRWSPINGAFQSASNILSLQRLAGNQAVQRMINRPPTRLIQRCGGEVHEGCACADEPAPVSRTPDTATTTAPIRRFTDGTADAPSPDLPDGSPYAGMPAPLLDMLRRTLTGKTCAYWAGQKPTNLGAAIGLLSSADINTLMQLHKRLTGVGLWSFIGTMTEVWSTSSLGIHFNETGSIQGGLPEKSFCKDTAVGELYHSGRSCWREMVDPGTPGLHVCVPGEVHIDPHQTVSGKIPGVGFGGPSWVSFGSVCWYSLLTLVDHMKDVEGGRAVNVFTRRGQDYGRIKDIRPRIDGLVKEHPDLAGQKAALDALDARLDAVGKTMEPWAIRGFEGTDGSAEAKGVLDELTAIESGITDVDRLVTEAGTADVAPPPGSREAS